MSQISVCFGNQIEQQLGPLPPQLQRSSSRPGVQLPAGSSAPVKPGAAEARPAGQSGLPWLGNDESIANSGAAVAFMPATMPGQMWHEALSPLGQELAKVGNLPLPFNPQGDGLKHCRMFESTSMPMPS